MTDEERVASELEKSSRAEDEDATRTNGGSFINVAAFAKSLVSTVTRCARCELGIGRGAPLERYVVVILNGRTYCAPCAATTEVEMKRGS
jgi:formylmethanofuran dehydrogenase subunit E